MVYSLAYRRPAQVISTPSSASLSDAETKESIAESIRSSNSSCMSHGIPAALSFDRIVSGGTCPPCTVRDFLNYLKYIEHSAENLQFYLWYRDYTKRWSLLSDNERSLTPEWKHTPFDADPASHATPLPKRTNPQIVAILRDTDFANGSAKGINHAFDTRSRPSDDASKHDMTSEYGSSVGDDKTLVTSTTHELVAEQAFEDAGMKWKPFTTQPFRDEINRIIATYIAEGAPRELNLSARERHAVLRALQTTTHPSAFRQVVNTAEYSLRKQAHPNFIRWTICNGNRPRVIFARGLGVFGILAGLVADLLITLSNAGRAWRVIPFLGWFIGIATLVAAWKGMCVVLHGMHHRHVRPWELFSDTPEDETNDKASDAASTVSMVANKSYEDEPWVAKYQQRNIIRKVFDREVWVQEPALRQIQDTIFLQAILAGFVLSCILVGIFCAVPHGRLY